MLDKDYIKLALRFARRGLGKTSPNPLVGAIIVKNNRIVGQGYHRHYGGKHAEINAMESANEDISGATLYVTLEPCCHYGKTPPCVDAIIQKDIGKVVIGTLDPNPVVSGKSVKILNRHGIETKVGVLEEECRALNEAYFKYMTTRIPLVTVKFAQTIDGRIATSTGNSQWLSSPASRKLAHKLRALHDAVMVGIGTIMTDNPQLNVRLVRGRNPTKIVLDSKLRILLDSNVLTNQESAPSIIVTIPGADESKAAALHQRGIEVLVAPEDERGKVDVGYLLGVLGQRGISSVLVEGGAETITSLLRLNLVDRLVVVIAPKIMGKGIEAVGELNISDVNHTIKLSFSRLYRSGEDIVIEAKVKHDDDNKSPVS